MTIPPYAAQFALGLKDIQDFLYAAKLLMAWTQSRKRVSGDRKAGRFAAAVGNKANGSVIEQEAFTSGFEKVSVAAYSSSSSQRQNAFQIHSCSLLRAIDSRSHRRSIENPAIGLKRQSVPNGPFIEQRRITLEHQQRGSNSLCPRHLLVP